MTRGGKRKDREVPERRCIVTGESQPARGLVRFVVGPDGAIVPDVAQKLPGRGIWVSADRASLGLAVRKKAFARAARQAVTVPERLADLVEELLRARVLELISLARKSGQAVAGYEKCRDLALRGEMAVLIQAHDGSERGKTKLRPPEGPESHVTCLSARELGFAFARDHVIHAALRAGGLAQAVVEEAARLAGLRKEIGGYATGEDKTDA
ncbi:MAG: RNA-binding protein [Rhodobacteraceae bacterium]|nr:MAG: RNA-binding protein [Paracoccaceae bacterium]